MRLIRGAMILILLVLGRPTWASESRIADLYFYIQADNDLMYVGPDLKIQSEGERTLKDLLEISKSLPQTVTLHIYFDPSAWLSPGQESQILRLNCGSVIAQENLGETDSTEVEWLAKLLSERSEANSFRTLIFWSHGDGWRSIESFDHSAPKSQFSYADFAKKLALPEPLDLVVFDACQMAEIEILEAYSEVAKAVLAARHPLPGEGIDYKGLIRWSNLQRPSANTLAHALQTETSKRSESPVTRTSLYFFDLSHWSDFRMAWNKFYCDLSAPPFGDISSLIQTDSTAKRLLESTWIEIFDAKNQVGSDHLKSSAGFSSIIQSQKKETPAWAERLNNWKIIKGGSQLCVNSP